MSGNLRLLVLLIVVLFFGQIFPARAPSSEAKVAEMRDNYGIQPGQNRTAAQQAGYQLLALAITLGIAIVSGLVTGNRIRNIIKALFPRSVAFPLGPYFNPL